MTNKLAIPAVLAAIVLVAGMFAFMPVQKASTVHTTLISQAGQSFRVASGATALGASDAGTEVFTLTCANDCQITSIEVWSTAGDALDIVHAANVAGQVPVANANLAAPADDGLGDITDGTNPGDVIDAIRAVSARATANALNVTPLSLQQVTGGTVVLTLNNSVDANGNAAVNVVFKGTIQGGTVPAAPTFTNN